jgi:transposase-like protein
MSEFAMNEITCPHCKHENDIDKEAMANCEQDEEIKDEQCSSCEKYFSYSYELSFDITSWKVSEVEDE